MPVLARLFVVTAALAAPAHAAPEASRVAYVTDGDTFRLTTGERIRIAGIDAPETHADQAHCAAERRLGDAAAARARALIDGEVVSIERVGRSYNRTVARVTLRGRDLAALLVAGGGARWWRAGRPKPDWCDGTGSRRHGPARRR